MKRKTLPDNNLPAEQAAESPTPAKAGLSERFKSYLESRSNKKQEKKQEKVHVAHVLRNIDTQLDSLASYNATLLEEVENLRKVNSALLAQLEIMRKRELISKIVAAVSGIISIVLVILKIFTSF